MELVFIVLFLGGLHILPFNTLFLDTKRKAMKVAVIGTGYVGLVTGTCFSEVGIEVTCVDVNEKKINDLNAGIIPIFEPGLEELVLRNKEKKRLHFTTSLKDALKGAEVVFIAVGTPPGEDGSADLKYVVSAAAHVGELIEREALIVTKSTVPVGTSKLVKEAIVHSLEKRGVQIPFHVASNPEFLKEGAAIDDFMKPDRIVIGVDSDKAEEIMKKLYKPFVLNGHPVLFMDIASAEMTKYASNAMLATRISFMNEVANLCEKVGADINMVRKGIGSDPRIGSRFIYPGIGYGGSCFPKDVNALVHTGERSGYPMQILKAVELVNQAQKRVLFDKLTADLGSHLSGKKIAVWGLAFKPNTDDMREAPAIVITSLLLDAGAEVSVYDPVAMTEARHHLQAGVHYATDMYEAVDGADALMLLTEWHEMRFPDIEKLAQLMKGRFVYDGRNVLDRPDFQKNGFTYRGIGLI